MKFNFTVKAINSPFDDSAFFMRNVYRKRAVLFDCGRLGNVDNSELLDISDVFVSHTHIDHFSGFDRFLRGCLASGNTIRFFGPEGFIGNVEGRLAGYNWNLIKDYDLTFYVAELTPGGNRAAVFSAREAFARREAEAPEGEVDLGEGFSLGYEFFDHGGITSVGYRVREPVNISVMKNRLKDEGLLSGAWIKELKNALRNGMKPDTLIKASTPEGEKEIPLNRLEKAVVEYKKPQDVTYITDIAPSFENYAKAVKFASGSCLLIIEAVFMKAEVLHAAVKNHLTLDLAKDIFLRSGSDFVRFHHFAPRYDRMRDVFFRSLNDGVSGRIFSCL